MFMAPASQRFVLASHLFLFVCGVSLAGIFSPSRVEEYIVGSVSFSGLLGFGLCKTRRQPTLGTSTA